MDIGAIIKSTANPIIWFFFFLALGLVLTRKIRKETGIKKVGWYSLITATLILYLLSTTPIPNLLIRLLECRYSPPSEEVLANLDVVVILGGGAFSTGSGKPSEASGYTYSRVFNGVDIFKRSTAKKLVLSGASPRIGGENEAEVMKKLAVNLGVPEDKIIVEGRSRNTMGHVIELAKMFPPEKKARIGIVTSALHMLRSQRTFRKRFSSDCLVPLPVGYISSPPSKFELDDFIPSADVLVTATRAIHEWIGIVWYGLRYSSY